MRFFLSLHFIITNIRLRYSLISVECFLLAVVGFFFLSLAANQFSDASNEVHEQQQQQRKSNKRNEMKNKKNSNKKYVVLLLSEWMGT